MIQNPKNSVLANVYRVIFNSSGEIPNPEVVGSSPARGIFQISIEARGDIGRYRYLLWVLKNPTLFGVFVCSVRPEQKA
jgi:hypothetical protein